MAWNGSDSYGVSGRGTRPACPQGSGMGGHAGAGACARLRRCFATYPPNASRSAAHFVTLPSHSPDLHGKKAFAFSAFFAAKNHCVRGLLALAIVVVGGGLAWWFVAGGRAPVSEVPVVPEVPSLEGQRTKDKGQTAGERSRGTRDPTEAAAFSQTNATATTRRWMGVAVAEVLNTETNTDGAVIERLRLADGRTVKDIALPKPVFRRPSDQLIAMVVTTRPGEAMPPLPLGGDIEDEFAQSLSEPIEDLPDDADDVRELKALVREAREVIAEEVKAGKTVREVLAECQREQEMQSESRLAVLREIRAVREADGDEAAAKFAEKANELLRSRGIPEVRGR